MYFLDFSINSKLIMPLIVKLLSVRSKIMSVIE